MEKGMRRGFDLCEAKGYQYRESDLQAGFALLILRRFVLIIFLTQTERGRSSTARLSVSKLLSEPRNDVGRLKRIELH